MPVRFDDDDGPLLEGAGTVGQDGCQPFERMRGASSVEAKDDHARFPATQQRCDLAEVEVERSYDPALRHCLRKDLTVRQALKFLIAQMKGIVALRATRRRSGVSSRDRGKGGGRDMTKALFSIVLAISVEGGVRADPPKSALIEETVVFSETVLDVVGFDERGKQLDHYDSAVTPEGDPVVLRYRRHYPWRTGDSPPADAEPELAYILRPHISKEWKKVSLSGLGVAPVGYRPPALAVDPSGDAFVGWLDATRARLSGEDITLRLLSLRDGATNTDAQTISDNEAHWPKDFTLAALVDGTAVAIWVDSRDTHFVGWPHLGRDYFDKVFARTRNPEGNWSPVSRIEPEGGRKRYTANRPVVGADRKGNLIVLWERASKKRHWEVLLSARVDGKWVDPLVVDHSKTTFYDYQVVPIGPGSAEIFWIAGWPTKSDLMWSSYDNGGLGPTRKIAEGACCPRGGLTSDRLVHLIYQDAVPHTGRAPRKDPSETLYYVRQTDAGWGDPQIIAERVFLSSAERHVDRTDRTHSFWQEANGDRATLKHAVRAVGVPK